MFRNLLGWREKNGEKATAMKDGDALLFAVDVMTTLHLVWHLACF
jgi:hypothetical protein